MYTEEHGHPMMRARHMPFPITPTRAKAWLSCMNQAMDKIGFDGPIRDEFYSRLFLTAQHMINTPDAKNLVKCSEQFQHSNSKHHCTAMIKSHLKFTCLLIRCVLNAGPLNQS